MGLSECSGMDQELFKCKPAIMRAFQAAKGAHKVIAGPGASVFHDWEHGLLCCD